jgi:hypothetical protein
MFLVPPQEVEFMVPRDDTTQRRIHSFYGELGWPVADSENDYYHQVTIPIQQDGMMAPYFGYWQDEKPEKYFGMTFNNRLIPSMIARGLRYLKTQVQFEPTFVVPLDEDIDRLFKDGGRTAMRYALRPPRDHAGCREFRLADPFNYLIRVRSLRQHERQLVGLT